MTTNKSVSAQALALLIPAVFVIVQARYVQNFQVDDALIYLRYVRNFHDGLGLVYNEGSAFNGLSSPLFPFLQILLGYISKDYLANSFAICLLSMLGAVLIGAMALSSSVISRIITGVVIANFSFFYQTFGMETPLFLMFIAISIYLYRVRSPYLVLAVAFAFVTRGEGVFLGILPLFEFIRTRRLPPIPILILSILVAASFLIFNYIYFGAIIAETAGAKSGQGLSGLWGTGILILQPGVVLDWLWDASPLAGVLVCMLVVCGFFLNFRNSAVWGLVSFCLLLVSFYIIVNVPGYHWYYGPFLFAAAIFIGAAVVFSVNVILRTVGSMPSRIGAVGILVSVAIVATHATEFVEKGAFDPYVQVGRWIEQNTPENASVAMVEIGTVGWHSEREIVDILGLVNPYNADYIGPRRLHAWLKHYQPDYIFVHDPLWPHEISAVDLERFGYYREVVDFPFDNYRLLAKNPKFDEAAALALVSYIEGRRDTFDRAASLSGLGQPYVTVSDSELFAHAPARLVISVPNDADKVLLGFGVRDGARNLHSGMCFHVEAQLGSAKSTEVLRQCFSPDDPVQSALRSVALPDGVTELSLSTDCVSGCQYGWTYWSDIAFDEPLLTQAIDGITPN